MGLNYLNDLTKGLVTGLQGIAGGIVEKSWRNNAEELFKQGQNYLTQMGIQQQNYIKQSEEILKSVDPSQQVEVGNRQTTEVGGDPTGQVQQMQGKEVNPNTVQPKQSVQTQRGLEDLFKGYFEIQGQLANNPYGKGFATSLEGMYKAQQPEYKEFGDTLYKITNQGAVPISKTKDEKWKHLTGELPFPYEEDGKYYISHPFANDKGEVQWRPMEVSKGQYEGAKDRFQKQTESPDELMNRQLDTYKGRLGIKLDFGGLGNKGRSGKQSKTEWDKLSEDVKKDVLNHVEDSNKAILKYGSWDKVPDDIKAGLQQQQDYLVNKRGQNRDDIANYIELYKSGELTDKKLRQSVKESTKTNTKYQQQVQSQAQQIQTTFNTLQSKLQKGEITTQEAGQLILNLYNQNKDSFLPEVRYQVEQILKQHGLLK